MKFDIYSGVAPLAGSGAPGGSGDGGPVSKLLMPEVLNDGDAWLYAYLYIRMV